MTYENDLSLTGEPGENTKFQEETLNSGDTEDGSVKHFLASLEKNASNEEKTGLEINRSFAKTVTTFMRLKPDGDCDKNKFNNSVRPENCKGLSKITVNQVICIESWLKRE